MATLIITVSRWDAQYPDVTLKVRAGWADGLEMHYRDVLRLVWPQESSQTLEQTTVNAARAILAHYAATPMQRAGQTSAAPGADAACPGCSRHLPT
jgi:hypothetical protein